MATLQSTQVARKDVVPSADSATEVIAIIGDYVVPATAAEDDIIEMCALPAGYVVVDLILDSPIIDEHETPTVTIDVGILSGTYGSTAVRTIGAQFIAASTVGGTGGVARMSVAGAGRIAPTTADRGIGITFSAAFATLDAGGTVRLTVYARPQSESV